MRTDFDAVIIGAGPAGSTAALLLARAGWSVALVEKHRFPRRKVCGECLAASNLPLLEALGIGPAFAASAGPALRRVALMRGEREIHADLPAADGDGPAWGRALGRETLDVLLRDQARRSGALVLQPWRVQTVEGAAGAWRCQLRDTESSAALSLQARVAIAAHGSWEARPASHPGRQQVRSGADLFAFKANFRGASLAEGLLPVLAFDGGYGGMVVADGGLTTLACCVRRDRLDAVRRAWPGLRAGEAVEALLRRDCAGVGRALQGARRDGPWLATGPIDPGIRLRGDDTLFRIGNAAGEAHPIIGEGMSMALQSAALLCAELLAGDAAARAGSAARQREVARRYARRWHHAFAPRLRLAAAFAHLAMRPAGAGLLMALAQHWPGLLTQGARWAGKLRCAADLAALPAPVPAGSRAASLRASQAFTSRAVPGAARGTK